MKKLILSLLLFVCLCFANEATLQTDKTFLGANEAAIVTLDVLIDKQFDAFPQFPESEEYSAQLINRRQSRINNMTNINGKITRQKGIQTKLYYQVEFKKTGSITLPPLEFSIGEKRYKTNKITFSIGTNKVDKGIEVKFIQSHTTVYKGQQSKLTLRILVKDNSNNKVSNAGLKSLLDDMKERLDGTMSMEILNPDGVGGKSRFINGVSYTLFDIELQVTAQKTGEFTFGPFNFNYYEEKESHDRFRGSLFSTAQTVDRLIKTPAFAYTIKSRPPAPKGFKGAMSRIILEGGISKNETKVGESITLKFSLRGRVPEGVIKHMDLPEIQNCEVFTPETKLEQDTKSSGIYSKRTFSYMLIPQKEGEMTIPVIKYSWFNVDNGKYVTESIGPFTITVGKGKLNGEGTKRYLSQSTISTVGEDIQYIQTELSGKKEQLYEYRNPFYRYLLISPWVVSILLMLWKLRVRFMPKNVTVERKKKAYGKLMKALDSSGSEKSHSPVALFETYLDERAALQIGSLTRDKIEELLLNTGISQESASKTITMLEKIEMARYAGSDLGSEVALVKEVAKAIEKEL